MQSIDLHLTLTDRLVHHIDDRRRINNATTFFRDLLDAGGLAQAKRARHFGDIVLAIILEQNVANIPEKRIAGTHQAFGQSQHAGRCAIGSVALISGLQSFLAVIPRPVMAHLIG